MQCNIDEMGNDDQNFVVYVHRGLSPILAFLPLFKTSFNDLTIQLSFI